MSKLFKNNIQPLIVLACLLIFAEITLAQDNTDTRSITSGDFQAQRQKSATKKPQTTGNTRRKKNIAVVSNSKRRYNLVKKIPAKIPVKPTNKNNPTAKVLKTEELGVTFWRLRPKNDDEDDDAPTFRVKVNNQDVFWTAERVSSTTKFRKGDRVRFTIESSRSGYIYIVNREFYADGTQGQAKIIFPTLKTRNNGENRVTAGSLIEIPGSEVQYSYFNVNPQREDYVGEELLIIISPEKLPNIEIGMKALAITNDILNKWREDWSAEVEIFDAADGEGIAYTQAEAEAARTQSRALVQEEPLPQTIFRVRVAANEPLFVPFVMQAN
jgi:hypothetical protein